MPKLFINFNFEHIIILIMNRKQDKKKQKTISKPTAIKTKQNKQTQQQKLPNKQKVTTSIKNNLQKSQEKLEQTKSIIITNTQQQQQSMHQQYMQSELSTPKKKSTSNEEIQLSITNKKKQGKNKKKKYLRRSLEQSQQLESNLSDQKNDNEIKDNKKGIDHNHLISYLMNEVNQLKSTISKISQNKNTQIAHLAQLLKNRQIKQKQYQNKKREISKIKNIKYESLVEEQLSESDDNQYISKISKIKYRKKQKKQDKNTFQHLGILQKIIVSIIASIVYMNVFYNPDANSLIVKVQHQESSQVFKVQTDQTISTIQFSLKQSQQILGGWLFGTESTKHGVFSAKIHIKYGYELQQIITNNQQQQQSSSALLPFQQNAPSNSITQIKMSQLKILQVNIDQLKVKTKQNGYFNSWQFQDYDKVRQHMEQKYLQKIKRQKLKQITYSRDGTKRQNMVTNYLVDRLQSSTFYDKFIKRVNQITGGIAQNFLSEYKIYTPDQLNEKQQKQRQAESDHMDLDNQLGQEDDDVVQIKKSKKKSKK